MSSPAQADVSDMIAQAGAWVAQNEARVWSVSDQVWDFAEPGLCEFKSSALIADTLEQAGFRVERQVSGLQTAFVARFDNGGPNIGLMCEYDATPGDSQMPVPHPQPVPGVTCGFVDLHNGIGAASMGAAMAMKAALEATGRAGSITVFGTPAEKSCIGKPYMARDGYFDRVDATLAWHPRPYTTVEWDTGPGCHQLEVFDFEGKSVYGAKPWNGASALDAATLMNVIVQFLREQFPPFHRISVNELITVGGEHTTSIPRLAQALYAERSPSREGIDLASDHVRRAAEAAALAMGVKWRSRVFASTRPWLPNHTLADHCFRAMQIAGAPTFPGHMHDFANEVLRHCGREAMDSPLDETLTDPRAGITSEFLGGADDVTEFCWHAPTARIYVAYGPAATELPNWAFGAFARTEAAHATVSAAMRAMAFGGLSLIERPDVLAEARREWQERVAGSRVSRTALLHDDSPAPAELMKIFPHVRRFLHPDL